MYLKVYNRAKAIQRPILYAYEYEITKETLTLPSITFKIVKDPMGEWKSLEVEGYVEGEDGRFVVKELNIYETEIDVYAVFDFEFMQNRKLPIASTSNTDLYGWIRMCVTPGYLSDWSVTAETTNRVSYDFTTLENPPTCYEALLIGMDLFNADFVIDNINNTITSYTMNAAIRDKGSFILDDYNLRDGAVEISSEGLFTWLYPYGKNGLTIESIEGVEWIVNKSYVNKNIEASWTDERFTDAQSLYNEAVKILNERCKPTVSYSLTLADFYRITGDSRYKIDVGDRIRLSMNGETTKQYVVKMVINEDSPESTQIELSSVPRTLVDRVIDIQKAQGRLF